MQEAMLEEASASGRDLGDYALMVHRATTTFSPFYLLYGREIRLPTTDNLSACLPSGTKDSTPGNPTETHSHSCRKTNRRI
jgi:hypothetical protein